MREILFKGKRTDNGEWVYGLLGRYNADYERANIIDEFECLVPVKTETVGQYTGLTDKNGKKIFEGDILDCITADFDGSDKFVQYTVTDITNFEQMGFLEFCYKIKVVGNIHDNGELLKGE